MIGVLEIERRAEVQRNQHKERNLLSNVLHLRINLFRARLRSKLFRFIAFLAKNRYFIKNERSMIKTMFLVFWFLATAASLEAQDPTDVRIGSVAPDFSLPYATRDSISRIPLKLSDFVGKRAVILAFYPADWSTGCTKEFCAVRDNFEALQALDAEVFAVSGDYVWSHHEWARSLGLPFKLLSDHTHLVAKLYNSFNEKSMYNLRTVFVVDKRGKISYSNLEYSAADLKDLEKLKSALEGVQ
jgi:peroxiredoxin Q/BCP